MFVKSFKGLAKLNGSEAHQRTFPGDVPHGCESFHHVWKLATQIIILFIYYEYICINYLTKYIKN